MAKKHLQYPKFFELQHPVVYHKLALLREQTTTPKLFRDLTKELSTLIAYEALADISMAKRPVRSVLETFEGFDFGINEFLVAPILRAGLGMTEGVLEVIPMAKVAHLGFYRDKKTLDAVPYYCQIPLHREDALCLLCDPMLATGNTILAAVKKLHENHIHHIKILCLIAAPSGVEKVQKAYPEIPIFSAALDRELNDHSYILPGLGDAGDRLWNTE